MLDTSLKAQDDRNPVPSFLNTINERIKMRQSLNAEKERQDYYNQLKSGLYGKEGVTRQPIQEGEGIGFNENGQYKIPAQQTMNPFGINTSGWGNPSGNSINVGSFSGEVPKQNSWGSLFNQSFNQPPTDNPQAQAVEGQITSPNYMSLMSNGQITPQQQQAFDEKMNLRRWIEWDAQNNGVTNPLVALQRYQMFMEPMRQQAETDELRNAYFILNDPNASDAQRLNAVSLIEYYKQNPYMEEEYNYKIGNKPNPQFDGDIDSEYGGEDANGAAIYSYLKQKGMPDEVIAGIMGNLQQESGFNPSAIGDSGNSIGIAQWYKERGDALRNFAQQRGKDWNDLNTQLDFLVDEINNGYPELIKGMTGLSPHDSALKFHTDYERSNDTPEMAAGRGHNATKIYNSRKRKPRYVKDNSRMTNKEMADYKYAMQNALSDKKFQQQVALAEYKENLRRGRSDNKRSSNNKNNKDSSDLHESLNGLSDIEGKYDENADDATQKNYKKEYDKAYGNVKSSIQKEYPNLKQNVEQLKSKGYTTKQIGIMLAEDIYNNNNTKIGFEPLADIVSEIITSSNYGDTSYNSKELSSEIKQELEKTLERTKTLRNRSKRRPNSYDSIFGGYFSTSNAGLTDRDILDRQGSEKKDATKRILSEAERVGNIKYDDDKKFKEANKTEIERLYDEVEAHKKGKKK